MRRGPGEGRPFLAAANGGVFASVHQPPLAPDVFLSLDVEVAEDWRAKEHRSYFLWEFGKLPELVVEIVSRQQGGELERKLRAYARMGVNYYVVYDPLRQIQPRPLRVDARHIHGFGQTEERFFAPLGLGLMLWLGVYENKEADWLRWPLPDGSWVWTGAEQRQRADRERARAERLAAQLRARGISPEE
jgi:hypothetical protein